MSGVTTIFTDTSSRPLELGLRPALDQDVLSGPVRGEDEMSEIYTNVTVGPLIK